MSFSDRLNSYINNLGITAKGLSDASGISTAAISRYRAGERTPDPDGEHLRMLAHGLVALSGEGLDEQEVVADLAQSINGIVVDYGTFLANLRALLTAASISNGALARALGYDPSFVSRVLTGRRRPASVQDFVGDVAGVVVDRAHDERFCESIKEGVGLDLGSYARRKDRTKIVSEWLSSNYQPLHDPVFGLLEKLDVFNLDDFVRRANFDTMQVPEVPPLPLTKTYYGIREMMDAEIDFIEEAARSKSAVDVVMFSDMPIAEMAEPSFLKRWMFSMSRMLKTGIRVHVIHTVHSAARPLHEMMLGFEIWIPLYMTGLITPYYFSEPNSGVFNHRLVVSGTVALRGEAVAGHLDEGRYFLTKNRDEVRFYQRFAARMLEKACPLMRVVTKRNAADLSEFEQEEIRVQGRRRFITGTLPIATAPEALLEAMLERAGGLGVDRQEIVELARSRREMLDFMLTTGEVTIEVPDFSREEFAVHPASLDTAGAFIEEDIAYTYDEYLEHLEATKAYVDSRESCSLVIGREAPFRNVHVFISEGRNVVVTRSKGPAAHFIIEQPDLVAALERFCTTAFE